MTKKTVVVNYTNGTSRVFNEVSDITQPAISNGVVYLDFTPKSYVMLPIRNVISMEVSDAML